jgi:hypothetical protein
MVSTTHPTIDELRRWRRGSAEGDEVIAIGRHVAICDHCTTAAAQALGLDDAAGALVDDVARDGDHPDVEGDLFVYADGTAAPAQRAAIEGHLAACVFCRESVADLRALAAPPRHPVRPWILALAASLLIVVSGLWLTTRTPPPPVENRHLTVRSTPPASAGGDASSAFVARVRGGAPIGMPDVLRALRTKPDVLRGAKATAGALSPAGVVVKSAQPLFTWPAARGSRSTVQVFRGDQEVAHSGVLTRSQWRPDRMLARGVTYTWTVRVEKYGITEIQPSSPAPPARFHIVDADTFAALETAQRNHPGDHFLLGLLHARAGIDGEARANLRLVRDPRDAAVARRVLREIDSWPSP